MSKITINTKDLTASLENGRTIGRIGSWLLSRNELKAVLGDDGEPDLSRRVLCLEIHLTSDAKEGDLFRDTPSKESPHE